MPGKPFNKERNIKSGAREQSDAVKPNNRTNINKKYNMSRELKFRAYWSGVNQMVYFDGLRLDVSKYEGDPGMFIPAIGGTIYMGNVDAMQYTGLKDKNGKEIYEGDILRNPENKIGKVVFHDAGFALETERKNGAVWVMPLNIGMLKNKEVIGNIHENPDLLKQKP